MTDRCMGEHEGDSQGFTGDHTLDLVPPRVPLNPFLSWGPWQGFSVPCSRPSRR